MSERSGQVQRSTRPTEAVAEGELRLEVMVGKMGEAKPLSMLS